MRAYDSTLWEEVALSFESRTQNVFLSQASIYAMLVGLDVPITELCVVLWLHGSIVRLTSSPIIVQRTILQMLGSVARLKLANRMRLSSKACRLKIPPHGTGRAYRQRSLNKWGFCDGSGSDSRLQWTGMSKYVRSDWKNNKKRNASGPGGRGGKNVWVSFLFFVHERVSNMQTLSRNKYTRSLRSLPRGWGWGHTDILERDASFPHQQDGHYRRYWPRSLLSSFFFVLFHFFFKQSCYWLTGSSPPPTSGGAYVPSEPVVQQLGYSIVCQRT